MKFRRKMKKAVSKRDFRRKSGVHPRNAPRTIMRGGIRL